MLKLFVCTLVCAVFATSSYAASLRRDAEAVKRYIRSLPYGGGPVDSANVVGPMGPVDSFLDVLIEEDDSSEDLDDLLAKLEEVKKDPSLDFAQIEERVAEIQEQIAAIEQATTVPPVNAAEAAAEAQEQAPQQEPQAQVDAAQAEEQAAEAAEQVPQPDAPPAPEPAASGPDNSNKEDGDGHGNGADTAAADAPNAAEAAAEAAGQQDAGGQQDSGAGAPEPPTTPEPVVPDPPQSGNSVDYGNEDTKS